MEPTEEALADLLVREVVVVTLRNDTRTGGVHVAGWQSTRFLTTVRIVVQEHLGGALPAVFVLEADVLAIPLYMKVLTRCLMKSLVLPLLMWLLF